MITKDALELVGKELLRTLRGLAAIVDDLEGDLEARMFAWSILTSIYSDLVEFVSAPHLLLKAKDGTTTH